jgi:hypothetical protein
MQRGGNGAMSRSLTRNPNPKAERCSFSQPTLSASLPTRLPICNLCLYSFLGLARGYRKPSNWSGETLTSKAGE